MILLALACTAPVVPELLVPGDIAAEEFTGPEGLGSALATDGDEVFATVPEDCTVHALRSGEVVVYPGEPVDLWLEHGELRVGVGGLGVFDRSGELLAEVDGARAFAGGDWGWVGAAAGRVERSDGQAWELIDPRRVAASASRTIALACEGVCFAVDLDSGAVLGTAGARGDVDLQDGVAWWSDPESVLDDGAGSLWSEDGAQIVGEDFDHIGRSITRGWAAGVMNGNLIPPRARLVSLNGSADLAVEDALYGKPVLLSAQGQNLLVGVPQSPGPGETQGSVYFLELPEI